MAPQQTKRQRVETELDSGEDTVEEPIIDTLNREFETDKDELSVGIMAFASPTPLSRMTGKLKDLYEDFYVYEIDAAGNLVQWTDKLFDPSYAAVSEEVETAENAPNDAQEADDATALEALPDLVGEEAAESIKTIYLTRDILKAPFPQVICQSVQDKTQRTRIHQFFKEHFQSKFVTDVVHGTQIRVSFRPQIVSQGQGRYDRRNDVKRVIANGKTDRRKLFVQFHLYKENRDTMSAAHRLAHVLRTEVKNIAYAGTKDKRAVTVQCMTLQGWTVEKLASMASSLGNEMRISNLRYVESPLRLGDLSGNRFVICLRQVEANTESDIDINLSSLKEHGFINYYGMQRFGNSSISTHEVGRAILQGQWALAADLILRPRSGELPIIEEARKIWRDTKDAEAALAKMPAFMKAERQLLTHYARFKDNHQQALFSITRELRLMYVHSYQSYIWNCMVTERLRLFGKRVVVGDLVQDGEKVRVVETEQEAGNFSFDDVVLPQPGQQTQYPTHIIGDRYREMMAKDGVNVESTNLLVKLVGDYRRILCRPKNVSWRIVYYSDPKVPLIGSDEDKDHPNGPYQALIVSFDLPSSAYATMALREICQQRSLES